VVTTHDAETPQADPSVFDAGPIEHRPRRVRFKHPVRVTTVEGEPRAWRTLAANLSRDGLFVRMPQPIEPGTRVAISLEAQGQVLPFMEGEVRWCRYQASEFDGRYQGIGVRFIEPLHPRAKELVDYLVETLDTGRPLLAAPRRTARWPMVLAAGCALLASMVAVGWWWWPAPAPEVPVAAEGPGMLGVLSAVPEAQAALADMVSPAVDEAEGVEVGEAKVGPPADEAGRPAVSGAAPQPVGDGVETGAPQLPVEASAVSERRDDLAVATATGAAADDSAVQPGAPPHDRNSDAPAVLVESPRSPKTAAATPAPLTDPQPPSTGHGANGSPPPSIARAAPTSGQLSLPSGAARSVRWSASPDGLDVRPELRGDARITRVFALSGPPRLVFDIDGDAPRKSHVLTPVNDALVTRVRLGKQGTRTRVVVDLSSEPHRVLPGGDHAIVQF
jgi:hypothetical protein